MLIKKCSGFELEKTLKNTFEDFFNQSEVTFVEDGEEKTLQVLYLRYFDEQFTSFTPFTEDPVFTFDSKEVYFKDLVALVCLLKNPGYRHRKRVYLNEQKQFEMHFKDIQFERLKEIFTHLHHKNSYEVKSPLEFIQP
ncbi:hypothetical protein ACFSFW_01070 [Fredinandcohnia salidurans]|uniref:Uncharacterized protein n=1 Tax=Fredinandcohnia salidurans TaxID=2595041 RepID=A0ABW4MHE8_9BACI|nr:hypothetical protein [Fredinandcohnia onubensis]